MKSGFLLFFLLPIFLFGNVLKEKESRTALVTGGAGFVGSHLCERLILEGYYVICLDSLYTGKEENINHLKNNPRFKFIKHDVIHSIPISEKLDEIYNLACPASPCHYQNKPLYTLRTSILGVIHALELTKKNNAIMFQASTSEIYGDPLIHPQEEKYWGNVNTMGIRSCYDEGKRCSEAFCYEYNRQHKVKVKVGRIFNTYGPKMCEMDGRVVSNFIVQAINNVDMTIYGDGSQTRSFCYVEDLVEAIRRLMNTDDSFIGPINLGNPGEFSISELAVILKDLTKTKSNIIYMPLPKDDPLQRCPNISLAKKMLNWEPKYDLKCGLKKTIKYFESRKK